MGLINGSLQIGRTGLLAHQSALQVIGNNIANAGNAGFTRQTPRLTPLGGSMLPEGMDSGAGVRLSGIERNIDTALEQRLRLALSDQNRDNLVSTTLARLETLYNEMTDQDLSSGLSEFFNAFSELQSNPQDASSRSVVIQVGQALTQQIQTLRRDIISVYNELGDTMNETVHEINNLSSQIAELNSQIAGSQASGSAGALLDKRDMLLKDLSKLVDLNVVEQDNGQVTVYIDSDPLIQGTDARRLSVLKQADGDLIVPTIVFDDNSQKAHVTGGRAGAIDELITTLIGGNLDQLDTLASGIIFEVNKIHSSGQGLHGYTQTTSTNVISDPAAALNLAGLNFDPVNGSFLLKVKDSNTGQETVSQININLSGIGTQTSLNDLVAQLNAVDNVSATISTDGRLTIASTSQNYTFTFSEDSSGLLAAMGINGFFTGSSAADISVNADLVADPRLVACAQNNLPGDGTNAAGISLLRNLPSKSLGNLSITDYYRSMVGNVGTQTSAAQQKFEVHTAIAETLNAQRESISGVSIDEETVNLMSSQRAFEGAAKFISVISSMLDEVMNLI